LSLIGLWQRKNYQRHFPNHTKQVHRSISGVLPRLQPIISKTIQEVLMNSWVVGLANGGDLPTPSFSFWYLSSLELLSTSLV
jgi:hypothetical protein